MHINIFIIEVHAKVIFNWAIINLNFNSIVSYLRFTHPWAQIRDINPYANDYVYLFRSRVFQW